MALELTIYNRRKLTSKSSGKEYFGRAIAFTPGDRGAVADVCKLPPFYVREQVNGDTTWTVLSARTLEDAKAEALQVQAVRDAKASGVDVVTTPEENRERLTNKIAAYLAEIEANKSHATWDAYRRSTELFLESCRKLNVGDVNRADMLHFKSHLKHKKFSGRTVYNHFLNITIFFVWAKGEEDTLGLKEGDWPEKPERDLDAYEDDEIQKLLETAATTWRGLLKSENRNKGVKKDDRLLLWTFLNSGLRAGELANLTYGDVDTRHSLLKVRAKEDHNLKTSGSKRDVPVGDWLVAKIMNQMRVEEKSASDLIFPSKEGVVDEHLIRITQRIAELAGVSGRVDNHKFRATAITKWLRGGNTLFDVMAWVGHESVETVKRYAKKLQLEDKAQRRKATAVFDQFSTAGD